MSEWRRRARGLGAYSNSPFWRRQAGEAIALLRRPGVAESPHIERDRNEGLRMLIQVPLGHCDEERIAAVIHVTRELYRAGRQPLAAVEPAAFAVFLARESKAPADKLFDALMLQGTVLLGINDVPDAIRCFEEAWTIGESVSSLAQQASAAVNMGGVFFDVGLYGDALAFYMKGFALTERTDEYEHLRGSSAFSTSRARHASLVNAAVCALHTNDYARGLDLMQMALSPLSAPQDAHECMARAHMEATYSRLLLASNRIAEARAHATLAVDFAERSGSVVAKVNAVGAQGLCDIREGAADVGRSRVLNALEDARQMPTAYRQALLTTVYAHEASDDPAAALSYHREFALSIRRAMRERIVLLQTAHLKSIEPGDLDVQARIDAEDSRLRSGVAEAIAAHAERLEGMAAAAEAFHDPDGAHVYRIGSLAALLARRLKLGDDEVRQIEMAARLHDIGMVGVPQSITHKRGSLRKDEREVLRGHPDLGADLLSHCKLPWAALAETIARSHHERWDGSGYPNGLRGNGIPPAARIVALADAFDAMTTPRDYAPTVSVEAALEEIGKQAGGHFDPQLAPVFCAAVREFVAEHAGDYAAVLAAPGRDSAMARARSRLRAGR